VADGSLEGARREHATSMAVPGVLCLVGGLMIAGGSFLDWFGATSTGVSAVSVSGTEGWEGTLTVACGIAAAVAGLLALSGRLRPSSGSATAMAALGLIVVGVAVFAAATARDGLVDAAAARVAASSGVDEERAREVVERAFDFSEVSVSVEAGVFVVLAGGALVTVAGVIPWLSLRARSASISSAAQAASAPGHAEDHPDA
jgi:hypothetical protein